MGFFDYIKKSLGLSKAPPASAPTQASEAPEPEPTAAATPKLAPKPVPKPARQRRPAQGESGIAGWKGPQVEDKEVALEAHKLMSWVIHEDFVAASYDAPEFQGGLERLESHGATAELVDILKRAAIRLRKHTPLWRRLALLYTDQYEHESARNIWQRLIDEGKHVAEASFYLGEIAERDGKAMEAAANYQRAIAFEPEHHNAWKRAEALKGNLPMPRKAAAATIGGAQTSAGLQSFGARAPDGYELKHPLGRGGYGTVYLANDTHLHRDVAIKFLHPHLTRDARRVGAFFDEARLVARLGLPGIVRIYDLDQEARVIVMEYLTRGTLRDRLSSGRALAPGAALRVAISLLKTLDRLHQTGIIHRDIKPENILFRSDGSAVMGDFGVAGLEDAQKAARHAGTLAYMAPEQKQPSDAPLDRRADLYAMGLVLVEMLAGSLPAGTATQVHEPEIFISMLPRASRELMSIPLERLLATNPEQRPSSALEVINTFKSLARQFTAQEQVPALIDELDKLMATTSPDDTAARAQVEAMRRALQG